jgi:hypothetical protein
MEKLSIFQQSNPMSRQHTHTDERIGKNKTEGISPRETSDADLNPWRGGDLAAPCRGGGRQQALREVVTGSSSPWTPAAEVAEATRGSGSTPCRRQSCAAARIYRHYIPSYPDLLFLGGTSALYTIILYHHFSGTNHEWKQVFDDKEKVFSFLTHVTHYRSLNENYIVTLTPHYCL